MSRVVEIWGGFVNWIPNIIGAIVALIIGWIIAMILRAITAGILKRVGLNRRLKESPEGSYIRRLSDDPAQSGGNFIYWLIIIITWSIAISALKIPILTDLINRIYGYIPNLLAAIVILIAALAFSAFISGIIHRWMGDTPTGKIVSTIIPIIILSISGFAILEQLQIAPIIITSTYIAIIGGISLGFGLAFGLGGREVAGRILNQAYEKGTRSYGQIRRDIGKGTERAERDREKLKDEFTKR